MEINPLVSILIWFWGITLIMFLCWRYPEFFIQSRKKYYIRFGNSKEKKYTLKQVENYKDRHKKLFYAFLWISIIISIASIIGLIFRLIN